MATAFQQKIENYCKAAFPCLYVRTTEESRCLRELVEAAKATGKGILIWSASEGTKQIQPKVKEYDGTFDLGQNKDVPGAFSIREKDCVYIFRDLTAKFGNQMQEGRMFRDLLDFGPPVGSTVIVTGPEFNIYPAIDKLVTVLDYDLPDAQFLLGIAQSIASDAKVEMNGATEAIVAALSGMTVAEAENAVSLSIIETKTVDPKVIMREKVSNVKKTGVLEIIEPNPKGFDAIGGFQGIKEWALERVSAFTQAAIDWIGDRPKGLLALGIPGTGKSLLATILGTVFGVVTLRFDFSKCKNSLVGESERILRQTLAMADAMQPAILWIDEIDKALAGSAGTGANDGGVSKGLLGILLQWLQDHKSSVFVYATANDVANMDKTAFRKGRFDEVFFVDVPNEEERKAIVEIHLKKRNRNPELATDAVIAATDQFVGAEIESVVKDALFATFNDRRELTEEDLLFAAKNMVPISTMMKEQVRAIQDWCQNRAKSASGTPKAKAATVTPTQTRRIKSASTY